MKLKTIKDLYIQQLKDLHSAEKQLVKALPKMAKAASSPQLANAISHHLSQTEEHVERLEEILTHHEQSPRGHTCKAMEGLIEEGKEMIECDAAPEVRDAGLIAAAQRIEHYEISGYGTARAFAELVGDKQGAKLLRATLDEEAAADEKLTSIAEKSVNTAAVS